MIDRQTEKAKQVKEMLQQMNRKMDRCMGDKNECVITGEEENEEFYECVGFPEVAWIRKDRERVVERLGVISEKEYESPQYGRMMCESVEKIEWSMVMRGWLHILLFLLCCLLGKMKEFKKTRCEWKDKQWKIINEESRRLNWRMIDWFDKGYTRGEGRKKMKEECVLTKVKMKSRGRTIEEESECKENSVRLKVDQNVRG